MCARHQSYFLMARLILNCDLGEDEPLALTEQLLALVDTASIGCGFHAGNSEKTRATIQLALKAGVRIGAHPGLPVHSGRGNAWPDPAALRVLLETQIGSFQDSAHSLAASVEYIKLHGSLYHAVEQDPELAKVFIDFLGQQSTPLAVFALAGGAFATTAEAAGLRVQHEAFVDRDYRPDGSLVPRSEPGAILTENEAMARLLLWSELGELITSGGHKINVKADTLCVHGDSPDALRLLRKVRVLHK